MANIDRLRIISAFGIVWYHIEQGPVRQIGHAGLPVFLMISCMLIVIKGHQNGRTFISKKAKRLIVPWLFWCVAYFIFNIIKALLRGEPFHNEFAYYMILSGPAIHLWYLPFAFVIGVGVNAGMKFIEKRKIQNVGISIFVAGLLSIVVCSFILSQYRVPWPFEQWIFCIPACFLGWGLGYSAKEVFRKKSAMMIAAVVSVSLLCVVLFYTGYQALSITYPIVVCLFVVAMLWHGRMERITEFAAPLTLGIYLVHPMVTQVINYTCFHIDRDIADVCIIFLISLAISFVIKQINSRFIRNYNLI